MFIVNLTYLVPLEQIDAAMKEHMVFLNHYYNANKFVASGRKVPRTGGIILVLAQTKAEVEAIMAEDPFCITSLPNLPSPSFKPRKHTPT
jgi:uncharacterized protein YciI